MRTRKVFVYVDSENVSVNNWYPCVSDLQKKDTLIVLISNVMKQISYDLIEKFGFPVCKSIISRTHARTKNALDFELVVEMTRNVISSPKSIHILISKDKGFTCAIERLSDLYPNAELYQVGAWCDVNELNLLELGEEVS